MYMYVYSQRPAVSAFIDQVTYTHMTDEKLAVSLI